MRPRWRQWWDNDPQALESCEGALQGTGSSGHEGGPRGGSEGVIRYLQNVSSKMTMRHEMFSLFPCKTICKGNLRKEKDQQSWGFRHYLVCSLESHLESSFV